MGAAEGHSKETGREQQQGTAGRQQGTAAEEEHEAVAGEEQGAAGGADRRKGKKDETVACAYRDRWRKSKPCAILIPT